MRKIILTMMLLNSLFLLAYTQELARYRIYNDSYEYHHGSFGSLIINPLKNSLSSIEECSSFPWSSEIICSNTLFKNSDIDFTSIFKHFLSNIYFNSYENIENYGFQPKEDTSKQ